MLSAIGHSPEAPSLEEGVDAIPQAVGEGSGFTYRTGVSRSQSCMEKDFVFRVLRR
jgi:hypothetical protein